MIVDINTYLGFWPYWKIHETTANGLINLQTRLGIDKAVVCSLRSIFYDCKEGNKEVLEAVQEHPQRLIGFISLSPLFKESVDDLKKYVKRLGAKGLSLFPGFHGYKLKSPIVFPLIEEAIKLGVPVMIPVALPAVTSTLYPGTPVIERVTTASDISSLEMAGFAEIADTYPDASLIIGSINYSELTETIMLMKKYDNLFVETSRLQHLHGIKELVEEVGAQRVLFGTWMPVYYAGAGLTKIKSAKISEKDKSLILGENAVKLLKL